MSLIPADNDFAMWAVVLLMVGLVLRLEKTELGQKISATIMILVTGAVLANFNIISPSNNVFGAINSTGVPVAIVLLLFNANLKKIFMESGWTLVAFSFGAFGTFLGVLLGITLLPLGEKTPELAGIFSATYIGGSVNFVGVSNAIGFDDSNLLAASVAADNVVGTLFMVLLLAIPSMKFMAKTFGYDAGGTKYLDDQSELEEEAEKPFSIERAILSLGISFLIVWISGAISDLIGFQAAQLLILTAITVAMATAFHEKVSGLVEAFPIGIAVMYMFLFMIGSGVDILTMIESGMLLALFAFIILATHLVTILTLSKLFKIGLPEVLVGSNACILGPPTAAAMAGAMGWRTLVTPAVLTGTFGYATANFVGVTLYGMLG
ncbi:MAG: DUF819 family protein [Emcibacteraceae bacterium]